MSSDLLKRDPTYSWQEELFRANPKASNLLEIEAIAFWQGTELGHFYHMRRIADFMFTKEQNDKIIKPLIWNPWSVRICKLLCDGDPALSFRGRPDVLGITGPASSSKTFSVSLYSFLRWYCNPLQTKGVASSTSIQAAKNKIWAEILQFANSVPENLQFYDILNSNPAIIKLPKGTPGATDRSSIELIAGDESQAEASAKVLGIKNSFFLVVVDEATEVAMSMVAALANVSKNIEYQGVYIGNAKDHDDPHGKVCEPKAGWESITIDDELWETTFHRGCCLHLDGRKSPNIGIPIGDPLPYPGLFSQKDLVGEEGSTDDIRFNRGFWAKGGSATQIYTQQDMEINHAQEKPMWLHKPERILANDPGFSEDGDGAEAVVVDVGQLPDGFPIIAHVATVNMQIDDGRNKDRSYAMAEKLEETAKRFGITKIENVAVDCTGTGASYPEIVDAVFRKMGWGGLCARIQFGGSPSELPYPNENLTPAGDMFANRVSEIWYVGKLYLQRGQFRGLSAPLIKDMCKRRYERVKQNKICVETKRSMRARGVPSPNEADSFFMALDLARSKYGFAVCSEALGHKFAQASPWNQVVKPKKSFKEWSEHYKSFGQAPELKVEMGRSGGWLGKSIKR